MMTEPKKLRIDWIALGLAFETPDTELGMDDSAAYLDLETGAVIFVEEELRSALSSIELELADELSEDAGMTPDLVRSTQTFQDLPQWQQQAVLAVMRVQFGEEGRLEHIPYITSHQSYGFMEDFIETVTDADRREQLTTAIQRRKPFRRFRAVLASDRRPAPTYSLPTRRAIVSGAPAHGAAAGPVSDGAAKRCTVVGVITCTTT